VLPLAFGEAGLPLLPALRDALSAAAGLAALRAAAAGYWGRRGLPTSPDSVVCGPGSKPLLFGLLLAIGADVAVPMPSWVSYAAQAGLIGALARHVPVAPGEGGICDEIYRDLVHDPAADVLSPAAVAPRRTVVTTALSKSLALGGWRILAARLPEGPHGDGLRDRLLGIVSEIWSAPSVPVQQAAAYAFGEPAEITERVTLRGCSRSGAGNTGRLGACSRASRRTRSTSERHRSLCATVATARQLSCYMDTLGPRPRGIESPRSSSSAVSRSSARTFADTAGRAPRRRHRITPRIPSGRQRVT
jgi:aspartate/methionine/tyrosine aminotransferase